MTANPDAQGWTHTPGPWMLVEGNVSFLVYSLDENSEVNRFSARIEGGYEEYWRRRSDASRRTSDAELAATAHLIAAAPALYEALEGAIGSLEADLDAGRDQRDADWEGIAHERLETARAALRLARGEA